MSAHCQLGPLVGSIVVTVKKNMGFGRDAQPIVNAFVELLGSDGTQQGVHVLHLTDDNGVTNFSTALLEDNSVFLVRVTAPNVSNLYIQKSDVVNYGAGNIVDFMF
ncbi:MAG: hypothetical protein JST20_01345 [Bacteroidetes bacterium]|nr:hypothetical protein [Bacteroidota bacterium]